MAMAGNLSRLDRFDLGFEGSDEVFGLAAVALLWGGAHGDHETIPVSVAWPTSQRLFVPSPAGASRSSRARSEVEGEEGDGRLSDAVGMTLSQSVLARRNK